MEIGTKLKQSRTRAGLTQEAVAETIGVSRQTISNWENNHSYPDIVSVIKLSDLYAVSLDSLLKGDVEMIQHLEESTNEVAAKRRVSRLIHVVTYLIIWAMCVLAFWLGGRGDAMGYSLVVLYLVLPVTTFVISIFIGKDEGWREGRWVMLLFFGVMYMLAAWATFSLANAIAFDKVNWPEITAMLPGILCSAVGLAMGSFRRLVR